MLILVDLGLSIATITMLTRCAFRVAELSQGFKGHIWTDQVDYMVLEGGMVSICVLMLTFCHPGIGFCGHYQEASFKFRLKKTADAVSRDGRPRAAVWDIKDLSLWVRPTRYIRDHSTKISGQSLVGIAGRGSILPKGTRNIENHEILSSNVNILE